MRTSFTQALAALARWLRLKAAPNVLKGSGPGMDFADAFRRLRAPSPPELLTELKNTAWTCASINAAVCASYSPRLYVATRADEQPARWTTRALTPPQERTLRKQTGLPAHLSQAVRLEEVLDHPLLTLLEQVNPIHNAWELWELTTLYQESLGSAYWYLDLDENGVPREIWPLPAQGVTLIRGTESQQLVAGYEYRSGTSTQRFRPEQVIHFKYPDPRDPYGPGLAPLRACWESVRLTSSYLAFKQAMWDNAGLPSAVLSPSEAIGEDERNRLEEQWRQRFQRGGTGQVLVADTSLKVDLLSHSLGDLATLAEYGKTREDIANAFHIPLSYLVTETNLANLQAAERQHLTLAIRPRLQRRDQKLNERLVPLFDPTGRLFVASPDPVPWDADQLLKQQEQDLKWGVRTINEIRQDRGLTPVSWGDQPLPFQQETPRS